MSEGDTARGLLGLVFLLVVLILLGAAANLVARAWVYWL